jgi:phospholipase/carboxylesterase
MAGVGFTHSGANDKPTSMLVVLHGLGMCAKDFEDFTRDCLGNSTPWVTLMFPEAPAQPVSFMNGKSVRRWFDITSTPVTPGRMHEGLAESVALVHDVFRKAEASGIPAHRIVVAGFSQGAALALVAGLTYERPLAGICSFSGWLPDGMLKSSSHRDVPIFMGHGDRDTLIPFSTGQQSANMLKEAGFRRVQFGRYANMAHKFGTCEHSEDLESFVVSKLPRVYPAQAVSRKCEFQNKSFLNLDALSTDDGSDRSVDGASSSDDEPNVANSSMSCQVLLLGEAARFFTLEAPRKALLKL